MDYYIIDLRENIGSSEYYEQLARSVNSNIIYYYDEYHSTCNFFLGLFIMSTLVSICICNIINPHPEYIEIKQQDDQSKNKLSNLNNI